MTRVVQTNQNNKIQSNETNPQLTKCGEIHINDASTDVFLFCSFCSDKGDEDKKFLRTLKSFIDHIKWHRSEEFICPKEDQPPSFELVKLEAGSDLSESLDEEPLEPDILSTMVKSKEEIDVPDISGDVLINILDLYKKCPCLWHKESEAKDNDLIEPTYKMLTSYYNKCTQQNKSVNFVRDFLEGTRECFLQEYTGEIDMSDSSPWYFPYMIFLLMSDEEKLNESIYTDFDCTICTQELHSQDELWEHLYQYHIEKDDDEDNCSSIGHNEDDEEDSKSCDTDVSEHNVLKRFIAAYESHPRLWNKENEDYHNRKLRNESYSVLLKILQKQHPTATRRDVITKIKYFRTKFSCERRKIQENKLLGMAYEPNDWHYEKMLFLVDEVKIKPKPTDQRSGKKSLPQSNPQKQESITKTTCSVCSKSFPDQTSWLDHMQCGHDNKAFQSVDGFFYCPICNAQSKTKNAYIRHLRHSHTSNLKVCQDCGTKFRFMSALAKHRAKVHHDFHPFKCDQCGKGFVSYWRMKAHCIIHWDVDDRPHKCEHCGAKFSNRANLKVHIRRHTRDFYLRCEYCDRTAATSTELRYHMVTHTKKYPCICDICGKGFRSVALLTSHQNECHSNTTFGCEYCKKKFQSLKKLRSHYQSHKPMADQECKECGKKFYRSESLQRHIRQKHQELLDEVVLFEGLIGDEETIQMDEEEIEYCEDEIE